MEWGDESYAMEELVTEIGETFLHADFSITPETMVDYSAYYAIR
jgi:antirestriction protein ArdC